MKIILQRLFQQEHLCYDEARNTLFRIAKDEYNTAHLASFLTVFQMRAITTEELRGFRDALLELCLKIDLSDYDSIDLCGTGGDGKDTFNISTLAAVVVAGAGYTVTKHGNYGSSSICGSSNVLEKLGYQFSNKEEQLKRQLDLHNLCFLHAPLFHPAMKAVGPVRKQLGLRTFFNLLGPLVNPIQPKKQIVGVSDLYILRLYHYVLQQTNKEFAIIHALDGYDEVSLTGDFKVITPAGETLLNPTAVEQNKHQPMALHGGSTIDQAADIFIKILKGKGTQAQNEVVCTNAGIAIQRFNPTQPLTSCIESAKNSLLSLRAFNNFKSLLEIK
ncbi:MAG: anthranilate phosphoribosyltransferase [Saprospiraceae bacterium]|nr:anthranilate phosphoribosyltransferase [Saprospiraceae bacterium]